MNLNTAYTALFQLGERVFGLNTGWFSEAIKVDKQWETWDLELLQGKISHGCVMNGIKVLELKAGRLGGNSLGNSQCSFSVESLRVTILGFEDQETKLKTIKKVGV